LTRIQQQQQLSTTPERLWLNTDRGVKLIAFYPFRDSYGGWLVYELNNRRYKQYLSNKQAKNLNVREVYAYGKRAI